MNAGWPFMILSACFWFFRLLSVYSVYSAVCLFASGFADFGFRASFGFRISDLCFDLPGPNHKQ